MASPISDDISPTDSYAFRGLAGQPRIQERLAAMSPRSAILSESARQERYEQSSRGQRTEDPAPKSSILAQLLETDIVRKDPRDEVMRLRELLKTIEQRSLDEAERAAELERTKSDAQKRVEQLAATRLVAEQKAMQAQQEVRLVQLQLENAQREIERSRQAVKEVEQQRDEAEASAARARAKARKLQEDMVAAQAREEGRRMGFQAGFDYAQAERKIIAEKKKKKASRAPSQPFRSRTETRQSTRIDKGKGKAPVEPQREDIFADDQSILRRTHRLPSIVPPPRVKTADDIIESPPTEEMSPVELPSLKQLPLEYQSEHFPMPEPAQSTPLNDFVPPPERDSEPPREYPKAMSSREPRAQSLREPRPPSQQQSRPDMRTKTPAVQVYEIDIPSASELNRQYSNSMENEHIIPQPQDTWVDADKYHEIRGTRPSAPSLLPPPRGNAPPPAPSPQRTGVKFPKLSRPSLSKTKEQAASWYRSFSLRRKNKRVIDPIPEEPPSPGPTTGTFTNFDSEPPTASEPPVTGDSQDFGASDARPSESWYQDKPPPVRPGGVPSSVRSGVSKRRPETDAMSVSTRVSQFDLLATPAAPHAAFSMRSGKEGVLNPKKVKEKDSVLSMIKEDPASRDNTPHRASASQQYAERPTSAIPQPDFGQRPVHHQPSAGTSQASNHRMSRRAPPSIAVPDPDQELEPFGTAYDRVTGGKQDFGYPQGDLLRRPSRASHKTPDTTQSIKIDVVPPSGIAPPVVNSPPHTGQNHLSPYVQYKPSVPAFSRPISAAGPAPSVAASRKQSKQSLGPSYVEPPRNSASMKGPYSYPNQSSGRVDDTRSGSRASNHPSQFRFPSQPHPQQTPHARPASVVSGMSRRPNPPFMAQHHPSTSQVSLNSITADGGVRGQPVNASASRLTLHTPIKRQLSNASLHSQGSYSRYDPATYEDPAFWAPDGPGPDPRPASVHPPPEDGGSYFDPRPPRAMSANSGLSYTSQDA